VILSLEEVLKATGGRLIQGGTAVFFRGVSTDSRTLKEGELFIALKGDRFDGHNYAMEALAKNAKGFSSRRAESVILIGMGFGPGLSLQ